MRSKAKEEGKHNHHTHHFFFLSLQTSHAVTARRRGYPVRGSVRLVTPPVLSASFVELIVSWSQYRGRNQVA